MAKTTTTSRPTTGTAKASAKPKAAPRKAVAKPATTNRKSSSSDSTTDNAMDLLVKLLESPLVADLLAVGATAALSAITASRFSRRDGEERKSGNAVKSAGKAAAAAIGRRLKEEFDAIREAAETSRTSGA